ncbi:MAG: hypothetical protein ABR875_00510 [Minisyncoccia bacterium]|jgi:sRNA-binding protein
MAKEKEIGIVIHWYDKIKVAVVRLSAPLKIGDAVKVRHGEDEFDATINSIQVNHENVKGGKKGEEVAVELPQKAKEGSVLVAE